MTVIRKEGLNMIRIQAHTSATKAVKFVAITSVIRSISEERSGNCKDKIKCKLYILFELMISVQIRSSCRIQFYMLENFRTLSKGHYILVSMGYCKVTSGATMAQPAKI